MFCPNCGHKSEGGERFCGQCGASLESAAGVKKGGSSRWLKIAGIVGGVALIVVIVALSGDAAMVSFTPGKASVAGLYICKQDPTVCMNLNEDGTFFYGKCGGKDGATGEWEVNGKVLRLHAKYLHDWMTGTRETDLVLTGEIKDDKIIIEESVVFEKQ